MAFATIVQVAAVNLSLVSAAPRIEHLSPPVLQRGAQQQIEILGEELDGALDVWTSTSPVTLQAKVISSKPERAVLEVTLPPESPLGLHGLRLATASGLSNAHSFLVDELPVTQRDAAATAGAGSAMPVELPACVTGTCRAAAIDRYSIKVQAGQRVTFEVIGNRFGKDFDPLITIRDEAGQMVAQADNDPGIFFDCRFEHTFAKAGAFQIDVSDARYAGDPTWHYVLRMGDFPVARVAVPATVAPGAKVHLRLPQIADGVSQVALPGDHPFGWYFQEVRTSPGSVATWVPIMADSLNVAVESEPNNDVMTATKVGPVPVALHGVLETPGDEDCFTLELTKGQQISIRSDAQAMGSPADLELVLLEPQGREAKRMDELSVRNGRDTETFEAHFDFGARMDGPHTLVVRDLIGDGGSAFAYRVEVRESLPELKLKSDSARVTLPRGTYQPIPLTVTRTRFAGPVELELRGAPPGVALAETTIPAEATEFVCHLQATSDAPLGLATLQIVGRGQDEKSKADDAEPVEIMAVAQTLPLIDKRERNKDLIDIALRDDQRYPPPSLTNRIALQITPAAPFDIELPHETVLMTKYVNTQTPIVVKRAGDFAAPVSFTATGGQIGDEAEERSNIFFRIPDAAGDHVQAAIFNRILTNYQAFRVDVTGTAECGDRRVSLIRCFQLDVKSAFAPALEPATIELEPGQGGVVKMLANRTPHFDGAVKVSSTLVPALNLAEEIEIPAGQAEVEVPIAVPAETSPGRYQVRMRSSGNVGAYEEEVNGPVLTVTVKKPVPPKEDAQK